MAQYIITATSAKNEQTETNTVKPVVANPDEPTITKIPFPSPVEFETQELADAYAAKYAKWLNQIDYNHAWDWVGHANLD